MGWRFASGCVFALIAAGCGSNPPPVVEQSPSPVTKPEETPVSKPAVKPEENSKPPVTPSLPKSVEKPTPGLDPALRSRLAALIVPGSAASWRVAEQPALDLEKNPPAVADLMLAAKDADVAVRRGAWHGLPDRLDATEDAQRALLAAGLADDDAIVRALALRIVSELPERQQPPLVPALAQLLLREDLPPENRAAVARLFGRLKTDAREATSALTQAAASAKPPKVRSACLVALASISEPSDNLPRFVAALDDPDSGVRIVALARLREFGPGAALAAEKLSLLLADKEERIREAAGETLLRIGEPAVRPLISQLAAPEPTTRRWAVFALGKLGPLAKSALPDLEKRLQDDNEEIRKLADLAIKRIKMP